MPASRRVSPSQVYRAQLAEIFASGGEVGQILEKVARVSVALILQIAFEAEVTEFLGRDRYARGERVHEGLRNGYSPMTVKTTAGPITVERPKLRGNDRAFSSRLLGRGVTRTAALESLVIASFVRGLSVRDVEATLAEALGEQATLSKSTVSEICQALVSQFKLWSQRDLSDYVLDYLFCDASMFKYHDNAGAEPLLCTWGITIEGRKVFIGLGSGATESYDAWHDHFTDLKKRGLKAPLLGITDGAPGLVSAFEKAFDKSLRQRCLVHRAGNALAKVSKADQGELKRDFWRIFDAIDAAPGREAITVAETRAADFERKYVERYPSAVACVMDDFASLTAYLHFPIEHRERVRHTNLLERTFGESRRRVKVIGRLPGEYSCLSLVWAVLDRSSSGWRGLEMTAMGTRRLQDVRRQLFGDPPLAATG
ncbi:MAG: IS256 family transposase [Candidatus Dormibacteraceae bacterium]